MNATRYSTTIALLLTAATAMMGAGGVVPIAELLWLLIGTGAVAASAGAAMAAGAVSACGSGLVTIGARVINEGSAGLDTATGNGSGSGGNRTIMRAMSDAASAGTA